MSDYEFEAYLTLLSKLLRLSGKQREAIAAELRDHLDQRMTELQARGVDRDDAVLRALEEFGDAAGLAAELSQIRQYVRRRRIMKATLTTVTAAAAVILLTLALLPQTPGLDVNPTAIADAGERAAPAPAEVAEKPDPNEQVRRALAKRIEVDFQGNQLENVIVYLRDVTGASVLVQWPFLNAAGVAQDTPITMQLKSVSARQALDFVLEQASGPDVELGHAIIDGVVVINVKDRLPSVAERTEIRMYNCRDLIESTSRKTGFGDPAPVSERVVMLMDLIRASIEPDAWHARGGLTGSMNEYNGLLVIRHTPETHERIAEFLDQLRKVDRQPVGRQQPPRSADGGYDGGYGAGMDEQAESYGGFE